MLATYQQLLAMLLVDAEKRAAYLSAPVETLRSWGFADEDAGHLVLRIPCDQLQEHAESLIRKRRGEVASLLPMSLIGLPDWREHFRRYAAQRQEPRGTRKHLDDAIAFAAFLLNNKLYAAGPADSAECRSILRYERDCLKAHRHSRCLRFRAYRRFPLMPYQQASTMSHAAHTMTYVCLWARFRARGRLRHLGIRVPFFSVRRSQM